MGGGIVDNTGHCRRLAVVGGLVDNTGHCGMAESSVSNTSNRRVSGAEQEFSLSKAIVISTIERGHRTFG